MCKAHSSPHGVCVRGEGVFLTENPLEGYVFTGVSLSTGGGGGRHPPGRHPLGRHPPGRHPPGQTPPGQTPPRQTPPCPVHAGIRSTSGRYASHWNAFLLNCLFQTFTDWVYELGWNTDWLLSNIILSPITFCTGLLLHLWIRPQYSFLSSHIEF